jgi:hypothetical protein
MVHEDGKFTYSNIVPINIGGMGNAIFSVYPNPAKDYVIVNLPVTGNPAQLQITDISGRTVKTVVLGMNDFQKTIDLTGLAKGIYAVIWSDGKSRQSINVAVQ